MFVILIDSTQLTCRLRSWPCTSVHGPVKTGYRWNPRQTYFLAPPAIEKCHCSKLQMPELTPWYELLEMPASYTSDELRIESYESFSLYARSTVLMYRQQCVPVPSSFTRPQLRHFYTSYLEIQLAQARCQQVSKHLTVSQTHM